MTATVTEIPVVEVDDLKVHFPLDKTIFGRARNFVRAVDGVSLAVERGETLALVGESGCGKTTLGRTILGLYRPTSGTVKFDGADISMLEGKHLQNFRRRAQIVFQDPYGSLNPRMKIGAMLEEPLRVHGLADQRGAETRARDLLRVVGLPADSYNRYPHEFSGGQRQRAGIARALVLNPELIVADEAVSALDVSIRAQIVNLLVRLQGELGLTYVFIAHDLSLVRYVSDRVAVMYLGQVFELAPTQELYEAPLHPYTEALLSAIPVPDPTIERTRERIILRGDVPSPARPPAGCRFHTRCWLRRELDHPTSCVEEEPELRQLESGHWTACHFSETLRDM